MAGVSLSGKSELTPHCHTGESRYDSGGGARRIVIGHFRCCYSLKPLLATASHDW